MVAYGDLTSGVSVRTVQGLLKKDEKNSPEQPLARRRRGDAVGRDSPCGRQKNHAWLRTVLPWSGVDFAEVKASYGASSGNDEKGLQIQMDFGRAALRINTVEVFFDI